MRCPAKGWHEIRTCREFKKWVLRFRVGIILLSTGYSISPAFKGDKFTMNSHSSVDCGWFVLEGVERNGRGGRENL